VVAAFASPRSVGCRCCGRCTASAGVADTQTCAECKLLLQNGYYDDREVWVPVVGFDGCEISDQGRVRDARTHTAVKATPK
jgi:hypothetical protein